MKNKTHNSIPNILTDKFLEGLNFELRTLLNGFVGPVQLLKFNTDDPELVEIFRMLDSSLSRLERLALRTSIVQNSHDRVKDSPGKDTINLIDLVKYCVLDLQTLSDLENITFKITDEDEIASIIGNYDHLLQAFEILFEMAISLSDSDTIINVEFTATQNQTFCKVSSATAAFPDYIGEMKCQEHESQTWDIVLAKSIIEQHNGEVVKPSEANDSFSVKFTHS